jgi:RNA polymerase sigma-70 factor (ECF subfamily)
LPGCVEKSTLKGVPEILENGGAAFATTHWSVVLTAQSQSPASQDALAQLCRAYWPPLYSFLRRQGKTEAEAREVIQGFFARLLERRDFGRTRREKGRLRAYLLASLKQYLVNERRRAGSTKRAVERATIPLEEMQDAPEFESPDECPDRIFDQRWAMTVLDQTMIRLTRESKHLPSAALDARLTELLADELDQSSLSRIAREFAIPENGVKQASHRLRARYRELLREEIAHTVATPGEIEIELRELIAALPA